MISSANVWYWSSTDGIVALLKAKEGSSRARTRALDPERKCANCTGRQSIKLHKNPNTFFPKTNFHFSDKSISHMCVLVQSGEILRRCLVKLLQTSHWPHWPNWHYIATNEQTHLVLGLYNSNSSSKSLTRAWKCLKLVVAVVWQRHRLTPCFSVSWKWKLPKSANNVKTGADGDISSLAQLAIFLSPEKNVVWRLQWCQI